MKTMKETIQYLVNLGATSMTVSADEVLRNVPTNCDFDAAYDEIEDALEEQGIRIVDDVKNYHINALVEKYNQSTGTEHDICGNKLISEFQYFIRKTCKDYIGRGVEFDDLVQEASLGFLKGVAKFDPTRGASLSTCTNLWMRDALDTCCHKYSRTIYLPKTVKQVQSSILKYIEECDDRYGYTPSEDEICSHCGITMEQYNRDFVNCARVTNSLDDVCGDDGETFALLTGDTEMLNPLDAMEREDCSRKLNKAIDALPERQGKCIRLVYGLDGAEKRSNREVAEMLHVSEETVRLDCKKGIETLHDTLDASDFYE